MKRIVVAGCLLGWVGLAQAEPVPPAPPAFMGAPELMLREMVSPDEVRFFMGEARQAARAAARGQAYLPAPETAARAREIGERLRARSFGMMEVLLDEIERELMRAIPAIPERTPPVQERTRT